MLCSRKNKRCQRFIKGCETSAMVYRQTNQIRIGRLLMSVKLRSRRPQCLNQRHRVR